MTSMQVRDIGKHCSMKPIGSAGFNNTSGIQHVSRLDTYSSSDLHEKLVITEIVFAHDLSGRTTEMTHLAEQYEHYASVV